MSAVSGSSAGCGQRQHNCVVVVVVVGGWEELMNGYIRQWVLVSSFLGRGEGGSVGIVSFENIVMFETFVVCQVIPAPQGTFLWCVPSLIANFAVIGATAFDTRRFCCSTFVCVHTLDIVRIVGCVSCSSMEVLCG